MSSPITIREVVPPDTRLVHAAMSALRPQWEDERRFVEEVDNVQRIEGYRAVGVFMGDADEAVTVAGFRVGHSLSWGTYLYVDDLATLPHGRRRGYGGALMDWLVAEATRLGCTQVHLDSGTGSHRFDAHRLYFEHRFAIHAYHFVRTAPV